MHNFTTAYQATQKTDRMIESMTVDQAREWYDKADNQDIPLNRLIWNLGFKEWIHDETEEKCWAMIAYRIKELVRS